MTVHELNREQLEQLKQNYLSEQLQEKEGRTPSWGELANAREIVPDSTIFEYYAGIDFVDDDFWH